MMSSDPGRDLKDRPVWLTTLAEADREAKMPVGADAKLVAAFRRNRGKARMKTFAAFATAAALMGVLWIPFSHRNAFVLPDQDDDSQALLADAMAANATDSNDPSGGFTPTLYASSGQPIESLRLVRVSVPKESLVQYGVRPQAVADMSSDEVAADLLVGQDGIARAIRISNK